jgi:hypothetical protein
MLRPKRDEIMVGRRKLHSEEFRNLRSSPNKIRVIRTGHVARRGRRGMRMRFWFKARRKETTRKT